MSTCLPTLLAWLAALLPSVMHPGDDAPMGLRLTRDKAYHTQPALLPSADGGHWLAWVAYSDGKSDRIRIARLRGDTLEPPQRINVEGDLFRPVLVSAGGATMLLFTRTVPGEGPRIYGAQLNGEEWSDAQPLPGQSTHTLNPEATGMPDGSIAVAYQTFRDGGYRIGLRLFRNGRWNAERIVSSVDAAGKRPFDSWDPVLAWDVAENKLLIAWTSYFPGDYDLCWATLAGDTLSTPRRIPQPGYDMHPAIASDPKGGAWLAWDNIVLAGHGNSGRTYIKHKRTINPNPQAGQHAFYVAAAKWERGELLAPNGEARVSDADEDTRHGGMPRVCVDKAGRLFIAYRTLHRTELPARNYYWDISTRVLDGPAWASPEHVDRSDGPTEEAAIAPEANGMRVCFQRDHRLIDMPANPTSQPAASSPATQHGHDHHADYGDPKLRRGDIYTVFIPARIVSAPSLKRVATHSPVSHTSTPPAQYRKGPYTVLFGDLHRHSNISRCLRGVEPDPDDHYRYSRDVCRNDFLGVSDHASHTSDYNWWRLTKLADLYYMPGDFTTLFGVEWNGAEGHKNVMSPRRDLPPPTQAGLLYHIAAFWKLLDVWGGPAISIPHTPSLPGQDTDWNVHNDKYERLVEVFQSGRGSFEGPGAPRLFRRATLDGKHVQDALAMGYRLGIIASSDHGYGASYACVYATDNTRDAVFDALHDRRTYGSTVYGIIIDFNINGAMMGRDVKRGDAVSASGYVRGTGPLDRVEILKDNAVVKTWNTTASELRFDWRDPDAGTGFHWYYLRLIQEDDEMAWSSPIWVVD